MVSALLKIVAELLAFFLPLARKRIDERDSRTEQEEVLDLQAAATAGDDAAVNAMFHDWETRSPHHRRADGDRDRLSTLTGCQLIKPKPAASESVRVIALPEEHTVKSLKAGDVAPFEGFLVGKARFSQLAPCFRSELLNNATNTPLTPAPDPKFGTPPSDLGAVAPPWKSQPAD